MITVRPEIVAVGGDSCGPACWYAKCVECKCCCGGKNHGIGERIEQWHENPIGRTRRVNGEWFYLAFVGEINDPDLFRLWEANRKPIYMHIGDTSPREVELHYHADFVREAGGILQRGSYNAQAKWPEVQGYPAGTRLVLLWLRIKAEDASQ